ncbi:hypothetical protein FGIG_12488, partial [Fasciola gigantica]
MYHCGQPSEKVRSCVHSSGVCGRKHHCCCQWPLDGG